MPTTAPTRIETVASAFNSNASPKTASITVQTGDRIVVFAISEGHANTMSDPTGGSLTYTSRESFVSTNYCTAYLWTSTATTGTTFSVSVARSGGTGHYGILVLTYRGSDGFGDTAVANGTSSGPTPDAAASLVLVGNNSAVAGALGDWNATNGSGRAYIAINSFTPTAGGAGETLYVLDTGTYTIYGCAYPDAGTSGATVKPGINNPTGVKFSALAIEVLGTTSGGVEGAAAFNFGGLSLAVTGHTNTNGTVAFSFGGLGLAVTGHIVTPGTAAFNFGALNLAITGHHITPGSAAFNFGALNLAVTGHIITPGSAAFNFGGLTMSIVGSTPGSGQVQFAFGGLDMDITGYRTIKGTAAFNFGALNLAVTGHIITPGSAAFNLGALDLAIDGQTVGTGSVAFNFGALNLAITGHHITPGTVAFSFGGLSLTVAGHPIVPGSVAFSFGALNMSIIAEGAVRDYRAMMLMFLP